MLSEEIINEIKKEMKYSEKEEKCIYCQYFIKSENLCDINIFEMTVSPDGHCKHGTFIY